MDYQPSRSCPGTAFPTYGISQPMPCAMQMLQLPLLGSKTFQQFLQSLYKAIVGEATAAEFYSRLLKEAPDALHQEFIKHAYEDELEHLQSFIKLYCHFAGQMPRYSITPVQYPSYKEGILMALKDELETVEFYRDMQLSTTDQFIRDTFYHAMVDELEHATQFSTLYSSLQ